MEKIYALQATHDKKHEILHSKLEQTKNQNRKEPNNSLQYLILIVFMIATIAKIAAKAEKKTFNNRLKHVETTLQRSL